MTDESPLIGEAASDAFLILLIENRDEAAMGQVFERYSALVYSIALRVLRDSGQAEMFLKKYLCSFGEGPYHLIKGVET